MECVVKYKPIIWKTTSEDAEALKMAYIAGDGKCPACRREGRTVVIEERYGETP